MKTITHHTELLNYLIENCGLRSYLEIGTFNKEHNFNKINLPFNKFCVDPDINAKADFICTSDDFFADYISQMGIGAKAKFDLIFIDGLHHADQAKKDFDNSLLCLSENGFIVLHDCNPHKESITHVPRDSREWCGDVYKLICKLGEYDGINFVTVDMDYGCAIVYRDPNKKGKKIDAEITWEYFQANKDLIRLISVGAFLSLF